MTKNVQQRLTAYVNKHIAQRYADYIIKHVETIVGAGQLERMELKTLRIKHAEQGDELILARASNDTLKAAIDRLSQQEVLYHKCHDDDQDRIKRLTEEIREERPKTTINREVLLEVIRELVRGRHEGH